MPRNLVLIILNKLRKRKAKKETKKIRTADWKKSSEQINKFYNESIFTFKRMRDEEEVFLNLISNIYY